MLLVFLLIQIITESLPISSSGHVALARCWAQYYGYSTDFPPAALWAAHGITAFLMLLLLIPQWLPMVVHPVRLCPFIMRLFWYGLGAETITVILYGLCTYLGAEMLPLWLGYSLLACVFASLFWCNPHTELKLSPLWSWFLLGCVQGIAVIPGLSRLGITYSMARWLGYSARHAWIMSCTLALPLFIGMSFVGIILLDAQSWLVLTSPTSLFAVCIATCCAAVALWSTRWLMLHKSVQYIMVYALFLAYVAARNSCR
jgi:undecaprenyl-diphosphatase